MVNAGMEYGSVKRQKTKVKENSKIVQRVFWGIKGVVQIKEEVWIGFKTLGYL